MLLLNSTRKGSVSCRRALLWKSKVKVSIFVNVLVSIFCGGQKPRSLYIVKV